MKTNISSSLAMGALLLGATSLATFGCSSDSNATPPVTTIHQPDSGAGGSGGGTNATGGTGNGGTGTGATSGTGATTGTGGNTNHPHVDGGVTDGGDGGEVVNTCVTQTGANGCISACPKTIPDYLNQCTAAGVCQTFDNATRLGATLWNNGNLVPLTP